MHSPAEDLYHLIHALSANEKRYFRLFAQRHGNEKDKLYMKVFDLIMAQEDGYDEEIVKKKLKTAAAIKQLPQTKNYLYDLIMQSMRLYRSDKNVATEVFNLIQDELFYTEKGLTQMRSKALKKAKELAYEYDLIYCLVTILQRERIYALKFSGGDPNETIRKLHAEEEWVFDRLNNESKLGEVFFTLWVQFIKDPLMRSNEDLEQYTSSRDAVLNQKFEDLHTFTEKFFWLRAKGLICKYNHDYQGTFQLTKQLVDLFSDYPQHRLNVMGNYIDALSNYLSAAHVVGNYDEFEEVIAKLEELPREAVKDDNSISQVVINNKILYAMNRGMYSRSGMLAEEFENYCRKFENIITESFLVVTPYNLSLMFFINGEYDRSLDYCQRVMQFKTDVKIELQHGASMLYLIILIEQEQLVFFESAYRSVVRSMKNRGKFDDFERLFTTQLKKIANTPERQRKPLYGKLYEDLLVLKKESGSKRFVFMTETLSWCASKTGDKKMAELVLQPFN